jgi:serine/threonine protein kinase
MPLTAGQTLSFYEILGPLGAGGMGEVYRAKDTRLEREVAIKVLPEELADDEERLRRFEREAKTLASLNHLNVAGIHGVDQEGEVCFLALELVPGEDLAARLSRGPLAVDEAIDVCQQIAEGLEAAHEAGVVHRDLKPANVRITPDGVVKILDFGLAKPMHSKTSGDSSGGAAEHDSFLMTEEGLVLGTPTYMSPEQARGKPVDRRTDIWAFGCVLYECLTGQRAFRGGSLTDILAAIVGEEPDLTRLPLLPASVRALLVRCLTKDPRVRLRDIGEARVLLQASDLEGSELDAPGPAQAPRSRGVLLVAGAVILGAALGAFVLDQMRGEIESPAEFATNEAEPPPVRRFAQPPALDEEGEHVRWNETILSPDGKFLAFTTRDGLVVRSLDSLESTLVPDTESTGSRFASGEVAWSPDSEHLAYIDKTTIIRVTPQGRSPVPLFSVSDDSTRLGRVAWLDDGRIVFGSMGDAGALLLSIPEGGGPATEVAVVGETMMAGHLHSISAVPGGRFVTVLHSFFGNAFTVLTEGDSGMRTLFSLPGESITTARWVTGDQLLFTRGIGEDADDVWAVPLSMEPFEVTGEPFFVQSGVIGASVSMDGTLAYVEQRAAQHQLAWWSAEGKTEPFGRVHDQRIQSMFFSKDLGSILYVVGNAMQTEVWKYDLRRGVSTEVETGPKSAMWAGTLPDGRIAYSTLDLAAEGPALKSFLLPATGRGEPEPWLAGGVMGVTESHALVSVLSGDSADLFVDDLTSLERRAFRVGDKDFSLSASVSPDGEWALLSSAGTVLLTRFPSGEGEWQVSPDGGSNAAFSPGGSEIHFVSDRKLYRVSLQAEPEVFLGAPELIGRAEEGTTLHGTSEEGSGRFLATQTEGSIDGDLVVVLGWAAELAGR